MLATLTSSFLHSLNCTSDSFPTTCPAIFQRGCVIFNRAKAAVNLSPPICPCCSEIYASKLANFPKKNLKTLRSVGPSGLPRAALEKFFKVPIKIWVAGYWKNTKKAMFSKKVLRSSLTYAARREREKPRAAASGENRGKEKPHMSPLINK